MDANEIAVPDLVGVERGIACRGGGYFPTLLKLSDGTLGAVVRGGAGHVGLRSRLDWIVSGDGGRTWSDPCVIVPGSPQWDSRGSAAGVMADGTLVVAYWECTNYRGEKFDPSVGGLTPWLVRSADGGRTWSAKHPLEAGPVFTWVALYGRILTRADGVAMLPLYGALASGTAASGFLLSRDGGQTWGEPTVIAENFNETSLLELPDGRLLAFLRDDRGRAVGVWQAESQDGGQTWGQAVQLTAGHQHPADACLLQDGRILLTYGARIGALAVGLMLSADGGRTWDWANRRVLARHTLVLRGKTWGDCGYPSTVQLDDGTVVTVYYRLGSDELPAAEQERCLQYERDLFERPPASADMRRFEEAVWLRYRVGSGK